MDVFSMENDINKHALAEEHMLIHLVLSFRETFAACVAAAGSLLSLVLVLKFIPKHTKKQTVEKDDSSGKRFIPISAQCCAAGCAL